MTIDVSEREILRILEEYNENGYIPEDWNTVQIEDTIDPTKKFSPQEAIYQYNEMKVIKKTAVVNAWHRKNVIPITERSFFRILRQYKINGYIPEKWNTQFGSEFVRDCL